MGRSAHGYATNLELLTDQGVDATGARANDLVLAVRADTEADAESALDAAEAVLDGPVQPRRSNTAATTNDCRRRGKHAGANVAVVSVPGPYAALEAHHALSAGLHVLLFSDGVAVDDEVALKDRADSAWPAGHGSGCGDSRARWGGPRVRQRRTARQGRSGGRGGHRRAGGDRALGGRGNRRRGCHRCRGP